MTKYINAKEFRRRFPNIIEDLKGGDEIIVLKRSKPIFKVIPFNEIVPDILNRAAIIPDTSQPDIEEISKIVHKIRKI